ncbi:hypothetical protein HPP92_009060 [Vanilla planifolia]|uniref:PsbP C-terminal domain-containing protein n=1 Tax=Vanilla planifolia TaxID=51239 RepID=A0A835R7H7_VANPL|nr:hypothetical protein HPP92_009279 [Vanilla planifolia]KAG0486965.1 hypothetical protein HPP92_009060 [Vanilla planifolia]
MDLLSSTATATSSCGLANYAALLPFFVSHLPRRRPPRVVLVGNSALSWQEAKTTVRGTRRSFTFLLLNAFVAFSPSLADAPPLTLERYTDEAEGFTLLKPSAWPKLEKAGATVLFEEGNGSNNIGVVVSPVRLSSLKDFGTPDFVAGKLIQAERRKESTKYVELISAAERIGHGGLPVYEFEYMVDSSRGGMKRIFSSAFIDSKKLYLLNISYSDRPENPLDLNIRSALEQILHSFNKIYMP